MSATNRGAKRNKADFYPTPEPAFVPLLDVLPRDVRFYEPSAGDGRLIRWLRRSGRAAHGADLHQANGTQLALVATGVDFLKDKRRRQFIITNPPFSIAQAFIEHATSLAPEVMFLLRLNFLGGQCRHAWWRQHEPAAIFVLSKRPKFGKNKHGRLSSDATEYGWFYWGRRWRGIRHLPL